MWINELSCSSTAWSEYRSNGNSNGNGYTGGAEPTPESSVDSEYSAEPPPAASPKRQRAPSGERRYPDDGALQGTITLDVDPTTGLIAVVCPVIQDRTFVWVLSRKKYCGPDITHISATPSAAGRVSSSLRDNEAMRMKCLIFETRPQEPYLS